MKKDLDRLHDVMQRIDTALHELSSRDAALTVAFFADKFIGTEAARACYNNVPDQPAADRAKDLRRAAAALLARAEGLEKEAES